MRPRTLLGLIAVNLVWSAHPAMGKLVLADFSPVHGAWLRYTLALLAYLAASVMLRGFPAARARLGVPFLRPTRRADWVLVALLGFLTFCFSPLFQMTGLAASRATDNALIIAMEPLMTVLLAWLFLGEGLKFAYLAFFGVAICGFGLLTGLRLDQLAQGLDSHVWGNLILLVSLTGEASYSVLGRKLVARFAPLSVFGAALAFGVLFLSLAACLHSGFPAISQLSWRSAFGLLWLGPLGTTAAYLYWMFALVEAPVASLALTLFIQPLMGSVWGYAFLDERLNAVQALGGGMIILAVAGQAWLESRSRPAKAPRSPIVIV